MATDTTKCTFLDLSALLFWICLRCLLGPTLWGSTNRDMAAAIARNVPKRGPTECHNADDLRNNVPLRDTH
jgi:hypothetical protein